MLNFERELSNRINATTVPIIDKTVYKIMKYLYGKRDVEFQKIKEKFGDDNSTLIAMLVSAGYAVIRLPDGTLTQSDFYLGDDVKISLLVSGNKYVEDRRKAFAIQFIPILVSITSVIVSIIGLVISLVSVNPKTLEVIVRFVTTAT